MTNTDLTYEELAEILYSVRDLSFADGTNVINRILTLQESKKSEDPIDVYASIEDDDKSHKWLTDFALKSIVCQQFALQGKRIHAIKEIRTLTHASLKQAKEAFEEAYPHWNANGTYTGGW